MIARVRLEIALNKDFDYLVPTELEDKIEVGSRVRIPFGSRIVSGFVSELVEKSDYPKLKKIIGIIGSQGTVTPEVLSLARWISEYYCCAPETAIKSIVPKAVRRDKEGWRNQLFVRLPPQLPQDVKLTPKQAEILNIVEEWRELPLARLVELANTTAQTIKRLHQKGLLEISAQRVERDPYAKELILPTQPLQLNTAQAEALAKITQALDRQYTPSSVGSNGNLKLSANRPPVFLLHGVTGSGKTEVYLQAIAHTLQQGKGAIVLVPEISLTPQTVERFKARFCEGKLQTAVAVLHSHLSDGERHDEWYKIRQGKARIVIGARSAIFAPLKPLGLIIVDEEHEHSYKQEDAPRYNARDVAVVRGQLEGAVVVLGSATPSLESYYNVKKGKYILLKLPERADNKKMPLIRVVDLRSAVSPEKGLSIFSPQLKEAIRQRLEKREQVILFLNRRGYSSSLQCPKCGYVAQCQFCSVAMTYHRQYNKLLCHICGYESPPPVVCPDENCKNPDIRFAGFGTQRVEEILNRLFPNSKIARMDSDTMQRKEDYKNILADFRVGKIDILVGTQMIAKGLHFPNVTLVGIIYADLSLHIPDFRAGERTFQLITQVAGRAGRGEIEGEVIVQSFTPYHPAIQFARRHDYEGFYENEISYREQLKYPPLTRIALITLRGRNEDKVRIFAEYFRDKMVEEWRIPEANLCGKTLPAASPKQKDKLNLNQIPTPIFPDLIISGPAPALIAKAHSYYRYHIMLRTKQITILSQHISELLKKYKPPEGVTIAVDIDPINIV